MNIKKEFELVYKTGGNVYNIVPLAPSTLKAYQVSKEDANYLYGLINVYSRTRKHKLSSLVEFNFNKCMIVHLPTYPLPGFITDKGVPVVNLSILPVKMISDYAPADVFALFLYTLCLAIFLKNKPFKKGAEMNVSNMFFSVFMRLFGKKAGLIGAFSNLIPKLQFLINYYTSVSMMNAPQDESTQRKIAAALFVNYKELDLSDDFSSSIGFLKSINKNDIIPMSENKFSTSIINSGGIISLPMFEDMSRFFATIAATSVSGNSAFGFFWQRVNTTLYNKLLEYSLNQAKRYPKV
ncbi:MAG: hypothetical protein KAS32_15485 [Candidatus Peribacteraceae bacterium]|nr:hypothetical protein [Candidatus Peribacteraceae bacterium]